MIIVTGGGGFIGSNLLAALEQSHPTSPLVVCDRFGDGDKWRNIAKRSLAAVVPPEDLTGWLADNGPDVRAVCHLGAESSTTATDADAVIANNFTFSQDLWRWCTRSHVPLIYASSAATYGDGEHGFDDDPSPQALARLRPHNLYGWSKLLFDRWAVAQSAAGDAPPKWAGLRFFNVYGPNEGHKAGQRSLVPQLHEQITESGRARLFRSHKATVADGEQKRDFIHVDDCVAVMTWLLDSPGSHGILNVGTGEARSFNDLAHAVFATMGNQAAIDFIDTPAAVKRHYQYFTQARIERLREAGYDAPFTPLESGVADYVRSYLLSEDPYR